MMEVEIRWKKSHISFFINGTKIKFDKDEVIFENPLLYPGAVIVEWDFSLQYQASREVAQLPILLKNKTYRLTPYMHTEPQMACLIKFEFFDRNKNCIHETVLDDEESTFVYPKEAYSYKIKIINTGIQKLKFYSLNLQQVDTEKEKINKNASTIMAKRNKVRAKNY